MDLSDSQSGFKDLELSQRNNEFHEKRSTSKSSAGSEYYGSEGSLTREERGEKVRKYWDKKRRRNSQKHLRYECRKNLAEKRFRF